MVACDPAVSAIGVPIAEPGICVDGHACVVHGKCVHTAVVLKGKCSETELRQLSAPIIVLALPAAGWADLPYDRRPSRAHRAKREVRAHGSRSRPRRRGSKACPQKMLEPIAEECDESGLLSPTLQCTFDRIIGAFFAASECKARLCLQPVPAILYAALMEPEPPVPPASSEDSSTVASLRCATWDWIRSGCCGAHSLKE